MHEMIKKELPRGTKDVAEDRYHSPRIKARGAREKRRSVTDMCVYIYIYIYIMHTFIHKKSRRVEFRGDSVAPRRAAARARYGLLIRCVLCVCLKAICENNDRTVMCYWKNVRFDNGTQNASFKTMPTTKIYQTIRWPSGDGLTYSKRSSRTLQGKPLL